MQMFNTITFTKARVQISTREMFQSWSQLSHEPVDVIFVPNSK